MSIIINTNISSMQGIAALNKNTTAMNKALERLSTGCRINSSKDDAAGCAISTSLTKEISSLNVAQNNAQMGQSLVDTANGALNNMTNMLQRIRDLAEQSANGTYGADERNAMQTEVSNLVNELYRTKNSTEFNGKQILGAETTKPVTEEEAIAEGYTTVHTAQELKEALTTSANCKVMLFADINLKDLEEVDGSNWTAVGTDTSSFRGTFDGNGFTISNLKINKPDTDYQGLFGRAEGATIKNVTLENVDVKGNQYTGGLVGVNTTNSTISNCSSTGSVTGNGYYTGGLVGCNQSSSKIINSYSNSIVKGTGAQTGGLAGLNTGRSIVENCSSSGTVTGNASYTGGLIGLLSYDSTIKNSSTTANVSGKDATAGVVGAMYTSKIENCSSTSTVNGTGNVGGLVGWVNGENTITDCKTLSSVSATTLTSKGAFIGSISGEPTLSGNLYNSTINVGMQAVGRGLDNPTEEQIKDNQELVIDPDEQEQKEINPINLQVGIENDTESVITVDTGFEMGLFAVNIESEYGARKALAKIDALMTKMTDKQTELGAISARLDSAMQYQAIQKTAKIATNSLIKDADFAAESSNYIKQQILQQTTSSLLSTANQNPNIALMLLSMGR